MKGKGKRRMWQKKKVNLQHRTGKARRNLSEPDREL